MQMRTPTFNDIRLVFALNLNSIRALNAGDLKTAANRQLLALRIIKGVNGNAHY